MAKLKNGAVMKSEIFSSAIYNRNKIKFLYGLNEIVLDPYYISREISGRKVIYGKMYNSCEIKRFEYQKISNIKVIENKKFSPIIPIISKAV
jgi:tricorn protease-like protein